jgi:hypothetical protein
VGEGFGVWIGRNLTLWKDFGGSPLWLSLPSSEWGRGRAGRGLLEESASGAGLATALDAGEFNVSIPLMAGGDKDRVVRGIVRFLAEVRTVLGGSGHLQETDR